MNQLKHFLHLRLIPVFCALLLTLPVLAQPTHVITDPERKFKEAKQLFIQQHYGLAYPLLLEIRNQLPANQASNNTYLHDDVLYYTTVCRLKLRLPAAEEEASQYIGWVNNNPRGQLMSYHLGKFYFEKDDFSRAIAHYEQAGIANLSNEEIGDAKFEMAYCYFNLGNFGKARPLFNEIHQIPDGKYYIPANYYYGFILLADRQYNQALQCFRVVENRDEYKSVVPYYIAQIYYFKQQKDDALKQAETALARGGQYYEKELKQLAGKIYFERKQFAKALPLLEYYAANSPSLTRESRYELSYCYYDAGQLTRAIDGFKQLSDERDSLGQNAMYLLGDCYLRTNNKAGARSAFQFCAFNSSNKKQQEISLFQYAKLSWELGYQDVALSEMQRFIAEYPQSVYNNEAREILVSLLAGTNNYREALEIYNSFRNPSSQMKKAYPRILYGRGVELVNDQQLASAEELFGNIISMPANSITPYAQFWKGEIAYRFGRQDEAIRFLAAFLQSAVPAQGEASPAAARYTLGYCWMRKEQFRQALSYFEPVARGNTTATAMEQDAFIRSADCYYMLRDFTKAGAMYDQAINNALPQGDYAMLQKAMIAGIKSSSAKIGLLNTLVRQYPQSGLVPDAYMEAANAHITDERFADALPYLTKIIQLPGNSSLKPAAYLKTGLSYYNLNKNNDALASYRQLLQLYPQTPEAEEATDIIRNIYVEEGRPGEYVEMMRQYGRAVGSNEADSLTYTAASLKYNNNDCNAAIAGFTDYISRFPEGVRLLDAHYYRSECYQRKKDWTNALKGYEFVNEKGLSRHFENATLAAARISYFELKDYAAARKYFSSLLGGALNQDLQLEALRGLVRCYHQLKDYAAANETAKKLLAGKGISTDDRSIAFLVLGKSHQVNNDCAAAISAFRSCAAINKTAWGAEARYELAACQFNSGNLSAAEKAAQQVIRETSSYDYWVTSAYLLLGDIFLKQKDYFNAKATYESVAANAAIPELKSLATEKLEKARLEEQAGVN